MILVDNKTKLQSVIETQVNGDLHPVLILNFNEIHWYNFDLIKKNNKPEDYIQNYFETFSSLFSQKIYETLSDYKNRIYVYSESFENSYQNYVLSLGRTQEGYFIPIDKKRVLNGHLNVIQNRVYSDFTFCDFEKLIKNQNKDKTYFDSFDSVKEEFMDAFDILDSETGLQYFIRLRYYYLNLYCHLSLYRRGLYKSLDVQVDKEVLKPVLVSEDGSDILRIIINGTFDAITISDKEIHLYDFKNIRDNRLYGLLKSNHWQFYSQIFEKSSDERIDDFAIRLMSYFLAFEKGYKKYVKSMKAKQVA